MKQKVRAPDLDTDWVNVLFERIRRILLLLQMTYSPFLQF